MHGKENQNKQIKIKTIKKKKLNAAISMKLSPTIFTQKTG